MIQQVIKGKDGLIRAANIRTASGITNCPITKLYPLEINASSMNTADESLNPTLYPQPSNANVRPVREAATRAHQQFSEWSSMLRGPPEDDED